MKKSINKLLKVVKKNKNDFAIIAISILAFIVGGLAIGFIKSFIIIGIVDGILLGIPVLINKKKTSPQTKNSKAPKTSKKKKKKILKLILIGLLSIAILCLIGLGIFFAYIVKNAPKFDPEKLYKQEASILYDSKGEIFARLGAEKREKITYDEMPEVLVNAIVATEDSRFFQHNGFDLPRFIKATMGTLAGRDAGGASTLTMQIVKNHFTNTSRSIVRKFTDIYLAVFQVEKKYTKEEILEFYVNAPFLGSNSYGVEQACHTFFGKSAKDINLAEAALIAGLFQAPGSYDPFIYPDNAEARRKVVLALMERHGYITNEERKVAQELTVDKLLVKGNASTNKYQGFIDTVVKEVETKTKMNPYNVPMLIYTTMDKSKQAYIDDIMQGKTYKWENDTVSAGVSVIDVKTGAIAAVGTGRKQGELIFNNATMISRQIGSTAKPLYDYGPGIEYNNWSTYTPFVDEPYSYSDGNAVENWDGKYEGFMTMRYALKASRNIPALKAFQNISNKSVKEFVTNLGLSPELESGIVHEAHSIGGYNGESPLSVSSAYAAFANGGYYTEPYSVTKIVYRDNNETFEEKPKKIKVMSPETAYMITNILVDTSNYALGGYSNVNGVTFGAKTGTTNFSNETFKRFNLPYGAVNDYWVAGISPEYSIAVWYGYEEISNKNVNMFGSYQHTRLFQAVAKGIFTKNSSFTKPNGVVEIEVEKDAPTALLPSEYTPSNMRVKELFKKGTEPTETSNRFAQLTNVKNLNSSISGNTITLTWDAVATPDTLNLEAIKNNFKGLLKNNASLNSFANSYLATNKKILGEIGYNIYTKNSNGSLTLLGFTRSTTYKHDVNSGGNITFVVKTAYSIFKSNASNGTELKVAIDQIEQPITVELNDKSVVDLKVGDTYTEPNPSILVFNNMANVTDQATITYTIKRQSDNATLTRFSDINTSVAETYIITYNVEYNGYTDTLTKKIIIK